MRVSSSLVTAVALSFMGVSAFSENCPQILSTEHFDTIVKDKRDWAVRHSLTEEAIRNTKPGKLARLVIFLRPRNDITAETKALVEEALRSVVSAPEADYSIEDALEVEAAANVPGATEVVKKCAAIARKRAAGRTSDEALLERVTSAGASISPLRRQECLFGS